MAAGLEALVVFLSIVAASAQRPIFQCDEGGPCRPVEDGTARTSMVSTRAERSSRIIGFAIIAAITLLVLANLAICFARCITSRRRRQSAETNRATPVARILQAVSSRMPPRSRSVKEVYVVNPAGSLKLGKKDSSKVVLSTAELPDDKAVGVGEQEHVLEDGDAGTQRQEGGVEQEEV